MACMWRQFARGGAKKPPRDVPPGHLAVEVGEASKRFVIRVDYLNHPVIRQLLDQAYEENVHNKSGPLAIPCNEFLFEDIIQSLEGSNNESQFTCHGAVEKLGLSSLRDSRPFRQGIARKSTC
ncbi:auxin-induced protein 15A-like [Castanea sativa]|uniref:auxin-induced protein 15A-like n=1 Tax=Castanea sativa TaxID=21020 RepID=UPI003F64FF4F